MVFVGGWGRSSKTIGLGPLLECDNCNNSNNFKVFETSRKATLYFIPVAKWDRQYWMVCPICSYGTELDSLEQAQRIVSDAAANLPPMEINEFGSIVEKEPIAEVTKDESVDEYPGKAGGLYFIAKIAQEAKINQVEFGEAQIWFLMQNPTSIDELLQSNPNINDEEMRGLLAALNNICVELIRSAINREKASGATSILVREGLRIPPEWEENYQLMYETELPWFVSAFAQNAFLGNPLADEDEPWMSP